MVNYTSETTCWLVAGFRREKGLWARCLNHKECSGAETRTDFLAAAVVQRLRGTNQRSVTPLGRAQATGIGVKKERFAILANVA
jgi:hypothetical protein